jgi:ribose transport system substrate-binding protein
MHNHPASGSTCIWAMSGADAAYIKESIPMRKVRWLPVMAAVCCLGSLAACGRGAKAVSGSSPSSDFKIAIVTRDFTNPYWAALEKGAQAAGKKYHVDVNVQAGSSETDATGEANKISTLAAQDYSCFGVVPVDATNVITPLVPVAKKKIPILNLDTKISATAAAAAGVSFATFIGSDNVAAGRLDGTELLKLLGGKGKVAILQGIAGEQNGINRETGFGQVAGGKLQVVQKAPANYEQALAQTVTDAILKAHPDITGIFSANDTMGLGAVQSVANARLSGKVHVVSVDGIQAAMDAVKAGTLGATVTQYPYVEGEMAVEACLALHHGKTIAARVVSPIQLITKQNVVQAEASFPSPFFTYTDPLADLATGS